MSNLIQEEMNRRQKLADEADAEERRMESLGRDDAPVAEQALDAYGRPARGSIRRRPALDLEELRAARPRRPPRRWRGAED